MSSSKQNPIRLIGACAPSSRRLASAMTRFVRSNENPKRILEVGAGTGAITKSLIEQMQGHQTSDVVEIFPRLASLLNWRFGSHKSVTIFCGNILNFGSTGKYDLIICSLPFNSLPPATTRAVINKLVDLSKDGAILSFFEYKILQRIAPSVLPRRRLAQYFESRQIIDRFVERYKFDQTVVNVNLPPALVHFLRIDKQKVGKEF